MRRITSLFVSAAALSVAVIGDGHIGQTVDGRAIGGHLHQLGHQIAEAMNQSMPRCYANGGSCYIAIRQLGQ